MIKELDFTMQNVFQLVDIEKICFGKMAWNIHAIQGEFNLDYSHFIADIDDNGNIRGYCGLRIMYEECQVSNIAVLPEFRRQGIGKALVGAMIDFAKKSQCDRLELEVNVSNEPAKSLYESCGFVVAGVRKNFYRSGNFPTRDAYTMVYNIKSEGSEQ